MSKLINKVANLSATRRPLANFTVPRHYLISSTNEESAKSAGIPIYQKEQIQEIKKVHKEPTDFKDQLALRSIWAVRKVYDKVTGYSEDKMTTEKWLNRCIFLETIAAVPGMVGGMTRHLSSLRTLKHDNGLIHHLLEEAENERTHLFIFIQLKQPSKFFQTMIALA